MLSFMLSVIKYVVLMLSLVVLVPGSWGLDYTSVVYLKAGQDITTLANTSNTRIFLAAGTYTFTNNLEVAAGVAIEGVSRDATILERTGNASATPVCSTATNDCGARSVIQINGSNVRIAHLTVKSNATTDACVGILARQDTQYTDILIDDVAFSGINNTDLSCGTDVGNIFFGNIATSTVRNSEIYVGTTHAFTVKYDSEQITAHNNRIYSDSAAAICQRGIDFTDCLNCIISDNTAKLTHKNVTPIRVGDDGGPTTGAIISGNTVSGPADCTGDPAPDCCGSINVSDATETTVTGNSIYNQNVTSVTTGTYAAIGVYADTGVGKVTVQGNICKNVGTCIRTNNALAVIISGNIMSAATIDGAVFVAIQDSDNIHIINNHSVLKSGAGLEDHVWFDTEAVTVSNIFIRDNYFQDGDYGVDIPDTTSTRSQVWIEGNMFSGMTTAINAADANDAVSFMVGQNFYISTTPMVNISRPTCSVTLRGFYWHVFSGAGVVDTVDVCAKDASNAYGWRTVY